MKDMRDILTDFFREGWEIREPGEGRFLVQMTELLQRQIKDHTVQEAIKTLERRVNQLGRRRARHRRPRRTGATRSWSSSPASPTSSRPSA